MAKSKTTVPPDAYVVEIKPNTGGQTHALSAWEFEVLFGGQAGPGKTWTLVVDALGLQFQQSALGHPSFEEPLYRGVIFRRTSTQLLKVLDEAHKYYPAFGAVYASARRGEPGASYTFPSGAKIFFCHMETEEDKRNHEGLEYQFVGFDELTQFTLSQYLFLFSRSRSTIPNLFPRVRSTTNPSGSGLWWVKKRFISGLRPMKSYWFLAGEDPDKDPQGIQVPEGTQYALPRCFIPGKLVDNPFIMHNDPQYVSRIKAMGSIMEKALLHGDWDAFGGDFFKPFNRSTMLVEPFEIPPEWRLIGSLDPGSASPCSFGLSAIDLDGNKYRVATYYEPQRNPTQHIEAILEFIRSNKFTGGRMPQFVVSGLDAWARRDRYSIMATDRTFADIATEAGLVMVRAVTDRINGWWSMKDMMERGKYFIFDGFNEPLVDEITSAVADERNPEDIAGRGNDPSVMDHALDDDRYCVMSSYKAPAPPPKRTVADIARERSIDSMADRPDWRTDW